MSKSRITSGWGIHCDIVNPEQFELQAAKEILAEVYDIQVHQVDELIRHRITERELFEREFSLYADYRRPHLS
ncbi:MAG: hypothetical protein MUO26_13325 [Methanotrichaceae archaeon]|nr:hypothetical protein [Methanotrichaceae archaeon]